MSPRAKKQIAIESPPSRSWLSEALVDALLNGIGRGLGDVAACHRAGVSVAAYRGWVAWAEAMERGDPHDGLTDLDTALLVGRLVYDGRAARAGLQSRLVDRQIACAESDEVDPALAIKAGQWLLGKLAPESWGDRPPVVAVAVGGSDAALIAALRDLASEPPKEGKQP